MEVTHDACIVMENNVKLIPPYRFGRVTSWILRGACPTLANLLFLHRQNLKTIVSLSPEPPTYDIAEFASLCGIKVIHFQVCDNIAKYMSKDKCQSLVTSCLKH